MARKCIDLEKIRKVMARSELIYKGIRFDVHRVMVTGSGGMAVPREMIVHPGAVTILPLLDDGRIVFIRNERFAVGEVLLELPAGTREPDEPAIQTARRELLEETGYRPGSIEPLIEFYTSPGICNEVMYGFVAKELVHEGQDLDDGENISVEICTVSDAINKVNSGIIRDAKTLTVLLYYLQTQQH